jgi:D-xylonolactonase
MNTTPSPSDATLAPRILGPARCIWPAAATLGEGTLWSVREQALYWVDIMERRLLRLDPATGSRSSWQFDEEISALAERAQAPGLVITLRRGFALFDPADGAAPRYLHRPDGEAAGNRFNDGGCDPQGRFWGGTMDIACEAPTGALYRLDPDGSCSRQEAGVTVSNGPTWSADGRTMFFNDTARGLSYAYDFDGSSGSISNRRLWSRFGHEQGYPDGMTTDAAGRLWIAH